MVTGLKNKSPVLIPAMEAPQSPSLLMSLNLQVMEVYPSEPSLPSGPDLYRWLQVSRVTAGV